MPHRDRPADLAPGRRACTGADRHVGGGRRGRRTRRLRARRRPRRRRRPQPRALPVLGVRPPGRSARGAPRPGARPPIGVDPGRYLPAAADRRRRDPDARGPHPGRPRRRWGGPRHPTGVRQGRRAAAVEPSAPDAAHPAGRPRRVVPADRAGPRRAARLAHVRPARASPMGDPRRRCRRACRAARRHRAAARRRRPQPRCLVHRAGPDRGPRRRVGHQPDGGHALHQADDGVHGRRHGRGQPGRHQGGRRSLADPRGAARLPAGVGVRPAAGGRRVSGSAAPARSARAGPPGHRSPGSRPAGRVGCATTPRHAGSPGCPASPSPR